VLEAALTCLLAPALREAARARGSSAAAAPLLRALAGALEEAGSSACGACSQELACAAGEVSDPPRPSTSSPEAAPRKPPPRY
jgi:hypothetical protein